MLEDPVLRGAFMDELRKLAASKDRLSVPKSRKGRRSLSVHTLLKKDKDGTLFKKAEQEFKLQGRTSFQGLPIAIENAAGSVRKGVDSDGKKWRTVFKYPYGYIKNTEGNDGEEIDAYVGPSKKAPNAFVIHQKRLKDGGFDEDKVMLGFDSKADARAAYLEHYNSVGPKLLGAISTLTLDALKSKLEQSRKHTKLAMMSVYVDMDEKPGPSKPGDVPSKDGTSPAASGTERREDGRDNTTTLPTNGAMMSSDTGAMTRL